MNTIFKIFFLLLVNTTVFSQNDSLPSRKDSTDTGIIAWKYNVYGQKDSVFIDTIVNDFQIYNPAYKKNFFMVGSTGNLSSPSYSLFLNIPNNSNFLNSSFLSYLTSNDEVVFYNTIKHYTNLYYFTNGSKNTNLQSISILHTQNINPYWNIAIHYNLYASDGIYANQKAKFSRFIFSSVYEKSSYNARVFVKNQQFKTGENGGMTNMLTNTQSLAPVNLPVHLYSAANKLRNLDLKFSQDISLVSASDSLINKELSISHSITYGTQKHFYTDNPGSFYSAIYYDSLSTYDSTRVHAFSNLFQLNYTQNKLYLFAGYQNTLLSYFSNVDSNGYTVNSVIAGSVFKGSDYSAMGKLSYNLTGFYRKDYSIETTFNYSLSKSNNQLELLANVFSRKPNYFYSNFTSNNFIWDTAYQSQQIIELVPSVWFFKNNIQIGSRIAQWSNYGYFDTLFTFNQLQKSVMYYSLFTEIKIPLKHFYFHTHLLYQQNSASDIVDFPDVLLMQSINYHTYFFDKALFTQFGLSVNYFTSFYGRGYIPAISEFYVQQNKKIGNYPYVDFYINFKVKRARIFFIMTHINESKGNSNYYSSIDYPMQKRAFRFGISWNFYN